MTNYYSRNDSADNTVITVTQPGPNSISGGGFLMMTGSSDLAMDRTLNR